ncbi:transglycosylase SLT domain-containing protein [Streptomyces sp. WP-1]|uniref:transglycosylase SLT domain-containing protein n=1 Tax=Streptomyces sp. WP-1 TaxID=3041497 RepID=UPI002649722D|nr:transglycosylase SLT domain-containing protein [Streptomyces sp. WP-1]WKE72432.1 transglycosylase SLT domain-containing protein [Streptomyces sp. WP-1]
MPKNMLSRARNRSLTKQHKFAVAGVAALGTAAIALSAVPGNADTVTTGSPATAAQVAKVATQDATPVNVKGSVTDRAAAQSVKLDAIAAQQKAADQAAAKQRSDAAAKKAADAAAKKAAQERAAKQSANRSAQRPQMQDVAAKTYANNLDGWIRQSLDIMHSKGIPGSYNGLYRNIMRESSGNPMAINNWDINAINGIPSKGLLQVIQPTFNTYHVPGTSWNIYDPVANITAACNYAAHRYGSMDNVNSAY